MARVEDGIATKERMADTLLALLEEGTPLRSIRIRQITDPCHVDRQTFYFHFHDIYDLASYTYNREIARLFGYSDIEDTFEDYSPNHGLVILRAIKQSSNGLKDLLFFMQQQNAHGNFYELVRKNVHMGIHDALRGKGFAEERIATATDMLTTAAVAIILSWLKGEIPASEEQLDEILGKAIHVVAENWPKNVGSL